MEDTNRYQEALEALEQFAGATGEGQQERHEEREPAEDRFNAAMLGRVLQQDGARDRHMGHRDAIECIERFLRGREDPAERALLDELLAVLRRDLT